MIDFSAAAASSTSNLAASISAAANSASGSMREQTNPTNQQSSASSSILNFRQSSLGQSASSNTSSSNSLMHSAFGNIGSGLGGGGSGGGSGGGGPPPPSLDMNEFPSLGGTVSINTFSQSTIGRPAYVGMVKDNVTNQSTSNEFNIQSEDFPALPGASPGGTTSAAVAAAAAAAFSQFQQQNSGGSGTSDGTNPSSNSNSGNNNQQDHHHLHHHENNRSTTTPPTLGSSAATGMASSTLTSSLFSSLSSNSATATPSSASSSNGNNSNNGGNVTKTSNKTSIHVTKDGHVTNIPPGMLNDQYGIAGLLALLQQADSNPNLFALTIGYDISNINMNLNSKERLYHTFPGPWNDKPLKPYEIDYSVPQEYLVFNTIREKLSTIKLSNFCEDLLFFLFYCFAGEHMQAAVGAELYSRDWRFHKDEGIWITRKQGSQPLEQSSNFERGSYIYFDTNTWSKLQKEMLIEYDRLDGPTNLS